jgi:MoaA/NifB/PqqE/SkfB family radical SAM enzyme
MFVEYSPVKEGTEGWVITEEQRANLLTTLESFRKDIGGVFVTFPGDEKQFGGCLSAGRGFIHVSSSGDLEPCPFAPFSDSNVRDMTLKDALQSQFLKAIRNNHEEMMETDGGCAVWKKREWVQSLIAKPAAGDINGPVKLD